MPFFRFGFLRYRGPSTPQEPLARTLAPLRMTQIKKGSLDAGLKARSTTGRKNV